MLPLCYLKLLLLIVFSVSVPLAALFVFFYPKIFAVSLFTQFCIMTCMLKISVCDHACVHLHAYLWAHVYYLRCMLMIVCISTVNYNDISVRDINDYEKALPTIILKSEETTTWVDRLWINTIPIIMTYNCTCRYTTILHTMWNAILYVQYKWFLILSISW